MEEEYGPSSQNYKIRAMWGIERETEVILLRIWVRKFGEITSLDLESLSLDLSQTWRPDGEYLGIKLALKLARMHQFWPSNLQTLAPTQAIGDEIREILRAQQF